MKHFARQLNRSSRAKRQAANEDISPEIEDLLVFAKQIYAVRSGRSEFLSAVVLGEPAYDMLLAMFIASVERRTMRADDLARSSGAPSTAAQRWIRVLEDLGLITRAARFRDVGDYIVELEPLGLSQIRGHLEHAWRALRA